MKSSELTELIHSKYDRDVRENYFRKFQIERPNCKVALVRFGKENQLLKYLLQDDTFVIDLLMSVRKNRSVAPTVALFCLVEDRECNSFMITGNDTIGSIYKKYKRDDGLLYINICKEKTFG